MSSLKSSRLAFCKNLDRAPAGVVSLGVCWKVNCAMAASCMFAAKTTWGYCTEGMEAELKRVLATKCEFEM